MLDVEQSVSYVPGSVSLRTELSLRNLRFARSRGLLFERTDGSVPSIVFGCDESGRHGNFHPAVYRRICENVRWARRLEKVHTASKRSLLRANWQWKELDCATSSDALLMNIFCHPEVVNCGRVQGLLGIAAGDTPEFGFRPRTPLRNGKSDSTEIDMKIGDLLVEAKLTESDFQFARPELIFRYRDLEPVFEVSELPLRNEKQAGYQLIRGTLAAFATGCSFCVLCDARRPDLMEGWYRVMRAVRPYELRCRLKILTWQELASEVSRDLQKFLDEKYGIFL